VSVVHRPLHAETGGPISLPVTGFDVSFETTVDVRYSDIDAMGHVNNAAYATYFEQARMDYFEHLLDTDLSQEGAVLATISIDYERPIELQHAPVSVAIDVPRVGTSSIPMTYEVTRADGELAATGETVQVAFDRETERPYPLPDAWREAIVEFHGLDVENNQPAE
jgi:acyl-CoA thioester hydrolase